MQGKFCRKIYSIAKNRANFKKFIWGKVKCNHFLFYIKFPQRWVQRDSCFITDQLLRGARVAQWREHSFPTNVAWVQFNYRHRRHMWVKFVVGSFPCSKRFFSGYSGFPLSLKTNTFKFQFDQESGRWRTTMWMCYLQIVIYLFTLLLCTWADK